MTDVIYYALRRRLISDRDWLVAWLEGGMPRIYHWKKFQRLAPTYYRQSDWSQTSKYNLEVKTVSRLLTSQLRERERERERERSKAKSDFLSIFVSFALQCDIYCYNFFYRNLLLREKISSSLKSRWCAAFGFIQCKWF